MEQINKKIFSRTSLIFRLFFVILFFTLNINIFADNILKNVTMKAFISPKYKRRYWKTRIYSYWKKC